MKKIILSTMLLTSIFTLSAQAASKVLVTNGIAPNTSLLSNNGLKAGGSFNSVIVAVQNDTPDTITASACEDTQIASLNNGERATFICDTWKGSAPMNIYFHSAFQDNWSGVVSDKVLMTVFVDDRNWDGSNHYALELGSISN